MKQTRVGMELEAKREIRDSLTLYLAGSKMTSVRFVWDEVVTVRPIPKLLGKPPTIW